MKRILINATQQEELRVAIVKDRELLDLDIEITALNHKKGNIYKATVVRVEPSLEAAFVDYGGNRHGFLPFKEISKSYYKSTGDIHDDVNIADVIHEKQPVLVQIEREEKGNKGAAMTTFISLAGRYLVMMPNSPFGGGLSRRIEGKERRALQEVFSQLDTADEESVIVRTAGIGHSVEDLQWDLNHLREQWKAIIGAAKGKPAPFLVYQENNILIRALRDHFDISFDEIIIDNKDLYQNAKHFLEKVMPRQLDKLKLYEKSNSLFSEYQIEKQIETAYEREVNLPSGGIIAFDQTEALLSIDINSSKATKGPNIEMTALSTNVEACEEIARQLRIRDAGGLIVIDFIDMRSYNNQKSVEEALAKALEPDRARIQIGKISRFGLLEMSRQHLRPSLGDVSHITCPRCKGSGAIRTIESCALAALRLIEEEAMKQKSAQVVAYLPVVVTSFLLNEKRNHINEIENHYHSKIIIIPDINMETPHFRVTHYRTDDNQTKNNKSYNFIQPRDPRHSTMLNKQKSPPIAEKPAVDFILPENPVPAENTYKGLLSRILSGFKRKPLPKTEEQEKQPLQKSQNRRKFRDKPEDMSRGRRNGDRRYSKSPNRRPSHQQQRNRGDSRQEDGRPTERGRNRPQTGNQQNTSKYTRSSGRPSSKRPPHGYRQRPMNQESDNMPPPEQTAADRYSSKRPPQDYRQRPTNKESDNMPPPEQASADRYSSKQPPQDYRQPPTHTRLDNAPLNTKDRQANPSTKEVPAPDTQQQMQTNTVINQKPEAINEISPRPSPLPKSIFEKPEGLTQVETKKDDR